MAISLKQQRYLLDRIKDVKRKLPGRYSYGQSNKPAGVLAAEKRIEAARKIIKAWEDRAAKAYSKKADAIDDAFDVAQETILFGEEKSALKAVKNFEKLKF